MVVEVLSVLAVDEIDVPLQTGEFPVEAACV